MEFFLPMIPPKVTNQMHRVAPGSKGKRAVFYDTPELADARQKFLSYLGLHAPEEKMTGALRLAVIWCFPAEGKHKHGEFKTTKPDTDNLQKLFKDCMTKVGFWKDDAQVAIEHVEKRFADLPGIYVQVSQLKDKAPIMGTGEERTE